MISTYALEQGGGYCLWCMPLGRVEDIVIGVCPWPGWEILSKMHAIEGGILFMVYALSQGGGHCLWCTQSVTKSAMNTGLYARITWCSLGNL